MQRVLTALHVAAKEGRADACRMLLRAGACCLEEMTVRERERERERQAKRLFTPYIYRDPSVPSMHDAFTFHRPPFPFAYISTQDAGPIIPIYEVRWENPRTGTHSVIKDHAGRRVWIRRNNRGI